jgi:hypothetical protein
MQIETFNHAVSTDDAQEKQARSYELAFVGNKKFVNSKFEAHHLNDEIVLDPPLDKDQLVPQHHLLSNSSRPPVPLLRVRRIDGGFINMNNNNRKDKDLRVVPDKKY